MNKKQAIAMMVAFTLVGSVMLINAEVINFYGDVNYELTYAIPSEMVNYIATLPAVQSVSTKNERTYITLKDKNVNARDLIEADRIIKAIDKIIEDNKARTTSTLGGKLPLCMIDQATGVPNGIYLSGGKLTLVPNDVRCG